MNRVFPVEIRNFSSLTELVASIDKGISWYETFLNEYNQQLGDLLREQGSSSEELSKKLAEKGLAQQRSKPSKKSEKPPSEDWLSFKGLMFSAEKQGKAEILFEAVDRIKKSLERLKETKSVIGELQKTGFGSDLVYSVYLVEGIPEKIFVEPSVNITPRYKLEMLLSTSMESLAVREQAKEETVKDKEATEETKAEKENKSEEKKQEERGPEEKTES